MAWIRFARGMPLRIVIPAAFRAAVVVVPDPFNDSVQATRAAGSGGIT
jgi:hypothetical protein